MEGEINIQNSLIAALKDYDGTIAANILYHHPELTNVCLIDEDKQETSTPLIEACKRGEWNCNKKGAE